jgi:Fur family peroxide stress response transcriptional regulator
MPPQRRQGDPSFVDSESSTYYIVAVEHKLRKSKQRDRILELLKSDHIHVTANWVYDQLRREFPTLSLGNVYRNLNILVEQGLANRLGFGSTFDVYEARREGHFHFICDTCGAIEDIEVPLEQHHLIDGWIGTEEGHSVSSVEFHGQCSRCRRQHLESASGSTDEPVDAVG